MVKLIELGSKIAKNGFKNEKDVVNKFNNWKNDEDAQKWLLIMGYSEISNIDEVKALVLRGYKTDVSVLILIKSKEKYQIENIQVKLVSNKKGFNQIDKRWLCNYKKIWNIPENVYKLFAYFTGELKPYKSNTKDNKRMFIYEFTINEQNELLNWIDKNKENIVDFIFKGEGEYKSNWFLVAQKINDNAKWMFLNIDVVINFYYDNKQVTISPKGSLKIGKITIQRKGGDRGKNTANMLQFKINPAELFGLMII
ncbi:hypothetical protein [Mycoplasma sp. CSL7503-lung]|uniref:hypothetical protein n=1 Tax=Mycoplasma sp. CSL7503-lung TaxID=536372 RepID=UPI0021D26946|nr:hypothetical protein [Mycoplasma sp. CSL7503-lung]MCU4706809.1 hypothetical protein [Mycoplasma sp. CSL7503-lung]